jgi:hypothetical protein
MTMAALATALCLPMAAQQYTGLSGLLHTPSAEMNAEGTAQIGATYLNKEFSPSIWTFHTMNYYLSITPFRWIELAYTCTLQKGPRRDKQTNILEGERYYYQDRYFSFKIQPLREGKWWPSIVVGANDPVGTRGSKNSANTTGSAVSENGKSEYFSNYFGAASKHAELGRAGELGLHVAYRHFKRDFNQQWTGVTAGVTFRPAFERDLRAVVEYTGDGINVGADWLLWKHLFVQGILQDGKHFSGGACFRMNLF